MKEPDDTPVTSEHIQKFLGWFWSQRRKTPFDHDAVWYSALSTLTLGQLRNGMRCMKEFSQNFKPSPPEFWTICTSSRSQAHIERMRKTREAMRLGKVDFSNEARRKRGRDEFKPGAIQD